MNRIITLTTDFGTKDSFVGIMKGVILSIARDAVIVDISHDILPQNVFEGAYLLSTFPEYFPQETIHIAVIDPGVGSERKCIILETDIGMFIGPDNGLFTFVQKMAKKTRIFELENPAWRLKKVSATFHGRDIFAPAAAYLCLGAEPANAGRKLQQIYLLDLPEVEIAEEEILGTVVHIDRFGNLITNIPENLIGKNSIITAGGKKINGISGNYLDATENEASAIIGSTGNLEIFLRYGNFSETYNISRGAKIRVKSS